MVAVCCFFVCLLDLAVYDLSTTQAVDKRVDVLTPQSF
jgi:hypothetical protein